MTVPPTSLTLSRELPVPVADGWAAWTVPALMRRWWWPFLADTSVDLDPRVGGSYRLESVQAGFGACGRYRAVLPGRRLVFTWSWISDGRAEETVDEVRVDLAPVGTGCRVDLEHVLDPRLHDPEPLRQGWSETLDHLVRYAEELGR
ncbi:Uncharacterized conserved protein YndB, AHSA1/START domain [Friedmanniella luteola]|uniref:Uncharacterized conserved protein YndB, AHSA1/START domain n=1 Tax=Friedmanniella luteola TaxID=546871 RepID=A0A1H1SLB8_9ACTN|nr:SRPBCC domain-containing protein [Friedmanniella luteola]SDS48742.1 Uncharacterized conserved protein YndB, AHSA1/START domain [Friedmanniella luteola]